VSRRYVEAWSGPIPCTCSTCGQHVENGDQLVRFDERKRQEVERHDRFRCNECARRERQEYAARRKAELDAMPRCEVEGCDHRGNWDVAGVLLCGRHKSRAQAAHRRFAGSLPGGLGLFVAADYSREQIIRLATTPQPRKATR
jgi:hypothetical protein